MELGDMPAYPYDRPRPDLGPTAFHSFHGMSIRQRYAMAAMQGILSNTAICKYLDKDNSLLCTKLSFKVADAMVAFEEKEYAERKQKETEASSQGS